MVSVAVGSPVPAWTASRLLRIAAALLIVPAFAQGVARTTVQITSPPSLYKEGGYKHLEALFGEYPRRWATIESNLIYLRTELCDAEDHGFYPEYLEDDAIVDDAIVDDAIVEEDDEIVQNADDDDALVNSTAPPNNDPLLQEDELSAQSRSIPQQQQTMPIYKGYILMVDRGSCTFVQKARNAQNLGAVAVIIADNVCRCKDPDCPSTDVCEIHPPILADDGSGGDIFIPSFLLYKQDADEIKERIAHSSSLTMKLEWAQNGITDIVEYELWTIPHITTRFDLVLMMFLSNLDQALGDAATFTPHHQIVDGVQASCRINGKNLCQSLCTNHGRYCGYLDYDWMGLGGRDFVVENLRRLCIRDVYPRDVWWNYTLEFHNRCGTEDFYFYMNEDCCQDYLFWYHQSGINSTLIDNCIAESGGTDDDVPNSLLDHELMKENELGKISFLPALIVNGHYANPNNELTPKFVMDAICGDYFAKSEPEVCRTCKHSANVAECVFHFNGWNSTLGDLVEDGLVGPAVVSGGMRRSMPSFALVGSLLALFGWV